MANGAGELKDSEVTLRDVLRAITALSEDVGALNERMNSFDRTLGEVADALVVPRVRRKVEGCLPHHSCIPSHPAH